MATQADYWTSIRTESSGLDSRAGGFCSGSRGGRGMILRDAESHKAERLRNCAVVGRVARCPYCGDVVCAEHTLTRAQMFSTKTDVECDNVLLKAPTVQALEWWCEKCGKTVVAPLGLTDDDLQARKARGEDTRNPLIFLLDWLQSIKTQLLDIQRKRDAFAAVQKLPFNAEEKRAMALARRMETQKEKARQFIASRGDSLSAVLSRLKTRR